MASYIRRRKFLATLAGAAAAWPLTARAQQARRPRLPALAKFYNSLSDEQKARFNSLRLASRPAG
jgi:LTXXQ motif family protein